VYPEGQGARDKALDYERKRAGQLRDQGQLDYNKHIIP